ncbi:MAG TPA: SPFH domain-containing protein, partial [Lysobacter sp.]|nr:SPFH domain-containing protein [Lysobacter sp.]
MKENPIRSLPGIPTLLGLLVIELTAVYLFVTGAAAHSPALLVVAAVVAVVAGVCLAGVYMVEPNQAAVLSLFGKY